MGNRLPWGVAVAVAVLSARAQDYYFKSGFEPNVYLRQYELNGVPSPYHADIYGTDATTGYDWETDLDGSPAVGDFRIYYEVGDTSDARATIVNDPVNPSNRVLKFQLLAANVPNGAHPKGRIQAVMHNNDHLKRFSLSVKLFLPTDIDVLRSYNGTFTWLTLMEFWNNLPRRPFPFRITLNIQKPDTAVGSPLYFGVHAQTMNPTDSTWDDVWSERNETYPVPTGQWMTLTTDFVEGDAAAGRYKVTITDTHHVVHTLFDVTNYTHHPDDPAPDGMANFNPMKLYTSGTLIDGMTAAGAELSVFWDDFELRIDSTVLGMATPTTEEVYPSPHPVRDLLRIPTKQRPEEVQILDMYGRVRKTIRADFSTIDVHDLRSGPYILRIRFADGTTHRTPLLKQ